MTISQTAEIIAEILHGVIFERPAEGVHWINTQSADVRRQPLNELAGPLSAAIPVCDAPSLKSNPQ